ncbi:MAG TPA: glycosyltransferase family 4 protein [Actinomycetes bacterium]
MQRLTPVSAARAPHVAFLNWRDTDNPEGGGSERYVERVAASLVQAGYRVTIVCAAHRNAPDDEVRDGVRFVRRGSKLGVYPAAATAIATHRLGHVDVVVDVQNGVPFLSRLVTRRPVIVLVHHVHREQWPIVYGRVRARIGWWVESWLAPRIYRNCQYVAVSEVTKRELAELGIRAERVAVVHNGTEEVPIRPVERSPVPTLIVLGRLVPHKRVEHCLQAVAELRTTMPGIRLVVVGDGWWSDRLNAEAQRLGVDDLTEFTGFVNEKRKHELLAQSWVLALPSLKEGWGLAVVEAATHGTPSVAYHSAGGVAESIVDGVTGVLVDDDVRAFTDTLHQLLTDRDLRESLGAAARDRAKSFTWVQTAESFGIVLNAALSGTRRVAATDPRVSVSTAQRLP